MNILFLTQFLSDTKGGGEFIFSSIARNLIENGHKVWIITNKIIDEDYSQYKKVNLIFVKPDLEYKGGIPVTFKDNITYTINSIIKGKQIIKDNHIDIIHSNNFAPALAGSTLSYLTSKPHITTIHDIFSLCGRNYWKKWARQSDVSTINAFLAPLFEKLMLKLKYNGIHTVSETSKEDLIKFGAKKPIYVIHNSINLSTTVAQIEPIQYQFVYVGRLVFYKNLEVIIKAIKIAKKSERNIRLIIIGGGPHRDSLEKLVNDLELSSNIEFRGHVSTEEKFKTISNSNALLFPSLCEGFGIVILEAFDKHKPVLVSNVRPMSDMIKHENNGFVLNPDDEKEWADYLLRIIKNPQEASIMGDNGNRLLRASYSQESMYHKIMKMYSDMLEKRNNFSKYV